jgi:dolichyl-phosphate-mannose--protein O-mannosyl transferase/Gpi18-like mannosyltransferase
VKQTADDVFTREKTIASFVREATLSWGFPVLLVIGALLRFANIHIQGFPNDVSSFESWALTLAAHGPASFYASTSFSDYPPGYFYILGLIGWIWTALFSAHDTTFSTLAILIKLPAVLFDLAIGSLLYTLVRRFASAGMALIAAALFLLSPAAIFISALWGQVDSVAAFFALLAIYALLRSDDVPPPKATLWIVGGWLSFAYSLLIKPQAAVLLPLMIAFAFTGRERNPLRLKATAYGIVAALVLTVVLVEPFHPSNPIAALAWLLQQLSFGTNVYPYNSVNAFNLWAITLRDWSLNQGALFWQPDSSGLLWISQGAWGIILVLAAVGLVVARYVQAKSPRALVEGCAIALLGFFVLATRMHERYMFDGVLFATACVPFARRYLWLVPTLILIFYTNLIYSWQYIWHLTNHAPPVIFSDSNLWGPWTLMLSLANVVIFFYLGWYYLGSVEESGAVTDVPEEPGAIVPARTRNWYDPGHGLSTFRKPLDHLVMGALGLASFLLSFAIPKWYWKPTDKIFDEVYFARAAEEYLKNARIYEDTHPPLTKLLITVSTWMFGGLAHGDHSWGWRFLDVVFGALVVMLLYAFARRITGSTIWAAIAALLLTFDGMHYVQSRIATPEGFVIFFSLAAVYAFYRFWIASQAAERRHITVPAPAYAAAAALSLLGGFLAMLLFDAAQHYAFHWPWFAYWMTAGLTQGPGAFFVVWLYFACGIYLLLRYRWIPSRFGDGTREQTFAEGSYALDAGHGTEMHAVDGTIVTKGKHVHRDGDLEVTYRPGAVEYKTPLAKATYEGGTTRCGGAVEDGKSAKLWLVLFTLALGALVSSKWYGVMGFGVSFLILILLFCQRYFYAGRPALWGNPRAFRLDGALLTIAFISMTVYGLVWVPDLARQSPDPNEIHNINDVVERQYSMYDYHAHLVATHPYASKWFEWPFDYVPIAYYYQDLRKPSATPNTQCCIYEITSMPNPFNMWLGLFCVPLVGILAWRERNKGYALLIVTYLLQWLPWMKSPRLAWEYHFYVDIPLICLCNVIVLQRVWRWASAQDDARRIWGRAAVIGSVALIAAAFVFFFPILSAWPLTYDAWHARMWLRTWVVGPG